MTMLSARIDDAVVAQIDAWCTANEVARSDFVRDALRREINRRRSLDTAELLASGARTSDDATEALMTIQSWASHEDWSAWHDWLDEREGDDAASR